MGKASKVAKAKQTSKAVKKEDQKKTQKIRTKIAFYRPVTRKTRSKPKLARGVRDSTGLKEKIPHNYHSILIQPFAGDKNTQKMEKENTITFLVSPTANKAQIKEAFSKIYNIEVRSVNTLNSIKGKKKAYIRVKNDGDALNLASKIGIL